MRQGKFFIAGLVLCSLGCVWLWFGAAAIVPASAPSASTSAPTETNPSARSHTEAAPPSAQEPGDSLPLPEPGTALIAMVDELRRRAEAGNAHAACRLGVELKRCAGLERMKADLREDEMLSRGAARTSTRKYDDVEQLERSCGNLAQTATLDYPSWLLRAGLAGHLGAKSRYAADDSYLTRAAIERPELVRQYAQYAAAFLTENVVQGGSDALEKLAAALIESDTPAPLMPGTWLGLTVKQDPVLARTYMQTLARERQSRSQGFTLSTDPAQRDMEEKYLQSITFTGESRAELDRFDQALSAAQIAASDLAVIRLIRERTLAAAELTSKIRAVDMHRFGAGTRTFAHRSLQESIAADAAMCDTGIYGQQ